MADTSTNPVADEQIVLAAFKSLDLTSVRSEAQLEDLVTARALTLRRLLKPGSLPMRTLGAYPIPARVLSIEEGADDSHRLLVTFRALRAEDGSEPETIRTDRCDGPLGRVVKGMWSDEVVSRPGRDRKVVIYKQTEQDTQDQTRRYRNAPYVTRFGSL